MRSVRATASKPYEILIDDDLVDRCGQEIASLFRPAHLALVTDESTHELYAARALKSLVAAGFEVHEHIIKGDGQQKNFEAVHAILDFLGDLQFLRSDPLVWLGGGMVGDAAGMAAALYSGGMYTVQLPSTLVAALELTASGRHTVDLSAGRNLACCMALPSLSLCDTKLLRALPDPLIRDGVAEMLKYALLGSEPLMRMLEAGKVSENLDVALELCMRIRMELVRGQEYDPNSWQLLRMGSVVGRAIEACSGGAVRHGDALGAGLLCMAKAAPVMLQNLGGCADRVEAVLRTQGINRECAFGRGELLTAIAADRKRDERYLTLAVPERVGDCTLKRVTMDGLSAWLEAGGIEE